MSYIPEKCASNKTADFTTYSLNSFYDLKPFTCQFRRYKLIESQPELFEMTSEQYNSMVFYQLAIPMKRHTIFSLEPVDRVVCIAVCWPLNYYLKDSTFVPHDQYLYTLGLDGIQ